MTNAENPISAIESLLAERRRYEAWMATLDTRRESTPAHVYERVRTDYEARLKDVLERLGGRSGDLRQMVETLAGRVSSLENDETTRRDALAEAELRALVGEFESDEWERLRAERDAEIQRLVSERGEVSGELTRVQELLSQANAEPRFATPAPGVVIPQAAPARQPEPAPQPAAAAPVPQEVAQPTAAAAAPAADSAPSSVPPAPTAAPSSFDELAFLQSLGDTRGQSQGEPAGGPPAAVPRPAAPVADAAQQLAADLAARTPFGTPADQPSQRTTSPAMRQMGTSIPEHRPAPAPEPRRTSDGVPSFLRDVPSEQVKTLKCQECGTMNYPTEWYCERCGGELAAM
jgi:hypothetical protein